MTKSLSERQKELYERIHDVYQQHYYDQYSMEYRRKYFYDFFFKQKDLNGCLVADLASGSGDNTFELLKVYPEAIPTGFDISEKACQNYEELTGFKACCVDLTKEMKVEPLYDAAIIVGGLHHCVADLPQTLENIAKLLKQDGVLMFMEPNSDYFLENLRKLWYRKDKAFFDHLTEHALSYKELKKIAQPFFNEIEISYRGGPAFFLVFNSAIFRMPKIIKRIYSPFLILLEKFYNKLFPSYFSAYFLACWQRK